MSCTGKLAGAQVWTWSLMEGELPRCNCWNRCRVVRYRYIPQRDCCFPKHTCFREPARRKVLSGSGCQVSMFTMCHLVNKRVSSLRPFEFSVPVLFSGRMYVPHKLAASRASHSNSFQASRILSNRPDSSHCFASYPTTVGKQPSRKVGKLSA